MRILVTGGAGFIGSALLQSLRKMKPRAVLRVVDFERPSAPHDEFLRGDILDRAVVSRAIADCTHVIHLAAILGVRRTETDSSHSILVNETGTANVLYAAHTAGVKHLVFASSSEIYGEQTVQPITEDAEPRPKSLYALSKLFGEKLIWEYRTRSGSPWRIVRFFNVYGPAQRREFVIPRFVDAAVTDKSLRLYGPGTQIRTFCYVDDATRCCALALLLEDPDIVVFNVGNCTEPVTITQLANRLMQLSGGRVSAIRVPFSASDRTEAREIFQRIPDVRRAEAVLGFTARVSLDAGLTAMLNYHRSKLALLRSGQSKSHCAVSLLGLQNHEA